MCIRDRLRSYVGIAGNTRFLRLSAAAALNFGALFLYIASAPAFVLDLLRLDERSFGWFFIPMISGMMLGAFVSGRSAGRVTGQRLANIGFACCGAGMLLNLGYNLWATAPAVPWAVLPLSVYAFGISLAFPIITSVSYTHLDVYKRQDVNRQHVVVSGTGRRECSVICKAQITAEQNDRGGHGSCRLIQTR